ncbi:MAG: UvrD-helicase domain-containing protein [Paludibacteraceae bacterium]
MLNIYRASAGSGKTYTLTKNYISLLFGLSLQNRHPHRRILAVTFTNKATDEMKSRILRELHKLSRGIQSDYRADLTRDYGLTENQVNERAGKILIQILHDYSSFSISTIDKFFQQVVRSFAREVGVSGSYNLELDNETTLQQAIDNLYMDLSENGNEQLLGWMTSYMEQQIEDSKSWNLQSAISDLGKEIFKESFQYKAEETRKKLFDKEFLRRYQGKLREIKTRFEKKVTGLADETLELLRIHELQPEHFSRGMMHKTLDELKDGNFEPGSTFLKYAEAPDKCYTAKQDAVIKQIIEGIYYVGLQDKLLKIKELIGSEEMTNYNSASLILKHIDTLGILSDIVVQIKKLTNEQNVMLLSDTNMLLNQIIDKSDTPFVYERTGVNLHHFMIDEFQDTSALQWNNFKPLIANSLAHDNTNMIVGDVKQSIYRWRNSDWKLLDKQIDDDFNSLQLNHETLDSNWRSDRNIVEFNNSFFRQASTLLQEKLNFNINEDMSENLEPLATSISHAYNDVEQKIATNTGAGYVRIEFVPNEKKTKDQHAHCLNRLPDILEDLVDKGYKSSDIAFLVRTNDESAEVIQFLLGYKNLPFARKDFSYDIVGNEGLLLASASSITFIIAVLKLTANPSDDIWRLIMHVEYMCGKNKQTENQAIEDSIHERNERVSAKSTDFSTEENACIDAIGHLALFPAVENLISVFRINDWHDETVFIQAFQDVVFQFSNHQHADLNSFLRWWDDNYEKQFVSMPENQDAFRIMTIHKSKGLDFKAVIVPFGDWNLEKSKNAPLLWCEPSKSPFNEIPLLPVQYGKKLGNSIFKNEYYDEQMHQYVDNLNTAYVAFTRARNVMICIAPKPAPDDVLPLDKVSNLSHVLQNSILGNPKLAAYWTDEHNIFEIGTITPAAYKEEVQESQPKLLTEYPVVDSSERLRIRHISADYRKTKPIPNSRVHYGAIMHEILRQTYQKGDEEKAIHELLTSGKINENELPTIEDELSRFWGQQQVENWFSADWEVLNEASILLPSGKIYRPDRVILKDQKAMVIDYKFGEEEHDYYRSQVKRYSDFLTQMGYEVSALLYYVSLKKIVSC